MTEATEHNLAVAKALGRKLAATPVDDGVSHIALDFSFGDQGSD